MSSSCKTCAAPLEADKLLCHYCGTSYRSLVSPDEQRRSLEELRQAMARAMHEADPLEQDRLRDSFLQNAFIPSDPEVLIEAALHCHQFFSDQMGEIIEVPKARYETCLTRLELLAVEQPSLVKKVAILRRQLRSQRAQERRNDIILGVIVLALAAGAVAAGVWLVRALFG